jgi:hypothetical protein
MSMRKGWPTSCLRRSEKSERRSLAVAQKLRREEFLIISDDAV